MDRLEETSREGNVRRPTAYAPYTSWGPILGRSSNSITSALGLAESAAGPGAGLFVPCPGAQASSIDLVCIGRIGKLRFPGRSVNPPLARAPCRRRRHCSRVRRGLRAGTMRMRSRRISRAHVSRMRPAPQWRSAGNWEHAWLGPVWAHKDTDEIQIIQTFF